MNNDRFATLVRTLATDRSYVQHCPSDGLPIVSVAVPGWYAALQLEFDQTAVISYTSFVAP